MTKLLEQAVAKARELPESGQNAIAHIVLAEIESERRSDESLAKSPEKLRKLANRTTKSARNPRPFPFFAQVTVLKRKGTPAELVGRMGVILGRSRLPTGRWNYGVFFQGTSYYLAHAALKPTGVVFKKSDIYSGDSIRVLVDESGKGTRSTPEPLNAHG